MPVPRLYKETAIFNPGQSIAEGISNAQATADAAAPKANAVKRTQRIYWRSASSMSSWTMPTAWVTVGDDGTHQFAKWTTKVPRLTANADGTGTKYLYLYTCEQREMADGTLAYTTVLLDDSTTVIDGGNIITGSVTANELDANSVKANIVQTTDLAASQIVSGTIDAARINASSLAIGGSTLGTVLDGKADDGDVTAAISTAAADATAKANAAAQTASRYITAIDQSGIKVHAENDSSDYVQITSDGMDVYNDGDNVASFGSDGARLGKSSAAHSMIDANGQRFYGGAGGTTQLANIGYGEGTNASSTTDAPYFTFGTRKTNAANPYSSSQTYNIGDHVMYNSVEYVCCQNITTAEEWNALHWKRVIGIYSTAIGRENTASDADSVAIGYRNTAIGSQSFALGIDTMTTSSVAFAFGNGTKARHYYTIAAGYKTTANSPSQVVIGKRNVPNNTGTYAFIIGNGTADDALSNAAVIDWLGNYIAQGWAGVIQMFAGSTPPAGWLLCDGSAVSRTEYATLYAAIGDTWGAGDGSTTFNLPDLRGRAPIGAGTGSGLSARALGGKVGAETVTLGTSQIPAHTHGSKTLTGSFKARHYGTGSDTGAQLVYTPTGNVSINTDSTEVGKVNIGGTTGGRSETVTINMTHEHTSVGGGGAHNNMQPSAVVNFIIHTGKTS